jgi:hypothetical protein
MHVICTLFPSYVVLAASHYLIQQSRFLSWWQNADLLVLADYSFAGMRSFGARLPRSGFYASRAISSGLGIFMRTPYE